MKISENKQAWLLCGILAIAGPVHAAGYVQTNLVASTDAYGASIVDPTFINAWGIAIRPAGLGGHFWVESNGTGTSNQFVGDVGGTPLYSDKLRLVSIPGPVTGGPAVSVGTPTGVVFNPGNQFTITQGSITGIRRKKEFRRPGDRALGDRELVAGVEYHARWHSNGNSWSARHWAGNGSSRSLSE